MCPEARHNKGVAEDWEESCIAGVWLWKMQRFRHQTEETPRHTAKMSTVFSSVFTSVRKSWQDELRQAAHLYQLTALLGRRHKTYTH